MGHVHPARDVPGEPREEFRAQPRSQLVESTRLVYQEVDINAFHTPMNHACNINPAQPVVAVSDTRPLTPLDEGIYSFHVKDPCQGPASLLICLLNSARRAYVQNACLLPSISHFSISHRTISSMEE